MPENGSQLRRPQNKKPKFYLNHNKDCVEGDGKSRSSKKTMEMHEDNDLEDHKIARANEGRQL